MHHSPEEGSDQSSLKKDTLTPSTRIRQTEWKCLNFSRRRCIFRRRCRDRRWLKWYAAEPVANKYVKQSNLWQSQPSWHSSGQRHAITRHCGAARVSQWKGNVSICTAYMPHSYVERWGGCADECHEIVIRQASPWCAINRHLDLSLILGRVDAE